MSERGARVDSVDVARGIASVLMIQGHATDAWTRAADRESWLYALEARGLQTLALPAFLLLSGAAIALRVRAAERRSESAVAVRGGLARRGLWVLGVGYAVSAVSALIDGSEGLETWLRADVLHVIGLSIAALSLLGVRGEGAPTRRALVLASVALVVLPLALCVPLTELSRQVTGALRFPLALFSEVPGVTRMPWVPLAAWVAGGALLLELVSPPSAAKGAGDRAWGALLAISIALAIALTWAQDAAVAALGGPLDRAHPAVVLNALQLFARGASVLAIGGLVAPRLPAWARGPLLRLGRGSLVAYVVHVPLCYGALGRPLDRALPLWGSLGLAVLLVALSYGAVWARDALRDRLTRA